MGIEERLQEISAEMNRCDRSMREVQPLADVTKIYRQVGKMFMLQPKKTLESSLTATMGVKNIEVGQIKQARQKLEQKARAEADALKELIGPEKFKQFFAQANSKGA